MAYHGRISIPFNKALVPWPLRYGFSHHFLGRPSWNHDKKGDALRWCRWKGRWGWDGFGGCSLIPRLWSTLHYPTTLQISLGFTWYVLQIMMLQSLLRVKETEVLVIPVLPRLKETLIAAISTQLLLFGTTAARCSSLKETRRSQQSHKYPWQRNRPCV